MIEVVGLSKSYGAVRAVTDLSFQVGVGEVVGFLGPNGAGKSTTLRILAGFLGADSGSVRIAGFDVFEEPLSARAAIGYMPESCPLHSELRVHEYLRYRAALKRVPARARAAAVSRAMSLSGVSHRSHSLIGHLSKGYRQRTGLADALVADPRLLILDEPTAGLDPNQIREVRKLIRDLGQEHTVLLSTHILAEVEVACDRALVMSHGKLVGSGTVDELRRLAASELEMTLTQGGMDWPAALTQRLLSRVEVSPGVFRVRVNLAERPVESWVSELCAAGIGVREVRMAQGLEEVFAALTESDEAKESADAASRGGAA
ncbi:MAG: hypothetical protein RJA70_4190 [Pseudomonadota bacterium]|jgi:ABC-2 type transport system ATP-binding protein